MLELLPLEFNLKDLKELIDNGEINDSLSSLQRSLRN